MYVKTHYKFIESKKSHPLIQFLRKITVLGIFAKIKNSFYNFPIVM